MRQSNIIFGVILFAFVLYITMRGQLPGYLDLFKKKSGSSSSSAKSSNPLGFDLDSFFSDFDLGSDGLPSLSSGSSGIDPSTASI